MFRRYRARLVVVAPVAAAVTGLLFATGAVGPRPDQQDQQDGTTFVGVGATNAPETTKVTGPSTATNGTSGSTTPATNGGNANANNNANPNCNGVGNPNCPGDGPVKSFGVTLGALTGLYPGGTKPMTVTYTNPESFDIKVTSVTPAAAATTSKAGCAGSNVTFGAVSLLNKVVSRNGQATVTIPVGLIRTAANACKGAVFTITVTASAVKN